MVRNALDRGTNSGFPAFSRATRKDAPWSDTAETDSRQVARDADARGIRYERNAHSQRTAADVTPRGVGGAPLQPPTLLTGA